MPVFAPRSVKRQMRKAIRTNGVPVFWNEAGRRTAIRVLKPRERAGYTYLLQQRKRMFEKAKQQWDAAWREFGWI